MSVTVLREQEDLDWAIEVHNLPTKTQYVVLYGNEDSPDYIEGFFDSDPDYDAMPDYTFRPLKGQE